MNQNISVNMTPEFIDVFSDDLSYIIESYEAHKNKFGATSWSISSTCRLYIISSVSCIEYLISEINKQQKNDLLKIYLAKERDVNHSERNLALKKYLNFKGIDISSEVLDDFLIIKRLRNIIVHSNWRDSNRDEAESLGYPPDLRLFNEDHLNRIKSIHKEMEAKLCFILFTLN
jgi:hypothetical protein